MIGSLLYLTVTRPDIHFSVCLCARFQASPRTSHRQAIKHIFRYLRHTPDFDLWYSASSSLAVHGFSDADFAGCRLDRKFTSGTCHIGKRSSTYSGTCVTLPTSTFGTPHLLLWLFMVFQTRILPGVGWIGSSLLGLASFWDLLWCPGLSANSRVLVNPLPRQSTLLQLVVALSSFGSHTP
jgi:hypothetical protein